MKTSTAILLLFIPFFLFAQAEPFEEYDESPDGPYIHVPREKYKTSPAYFFADTEITTLQVNVNADGENMLGDAANEPSLAIDPTNIERMAIGWRQFDTIGSNFRQAGFSYSLDKGETWTFPGPLEPGVFRSDPVLDFNKNGQFFYNSLESGYVCSVFKSESDSTWGEPVYAYGGDKQWMAIDRSGGPGTDNIYAFWKPFLSSCTGAFTRSADGGDSYEECSGIPNDGTRGTMAIGPLGELYILGETNGNFYLAKSTNVWNDAEDVVWDFSTTVNMNGVLSLYNGPNPNGMLGQAWVAVNTDLDYYGHVYIVAPVRNSAIGDESDVVFVKSEDGGVTWSEPLIINDDFSTDHYNWFPTISVAPNGRIDIAWVDTRDNPSTYLSALYYSYSTDGGETWSVNEKLSESFDPHLGWPDQNKIGDYYHSISDDEGMHLAWSATFNGEQDVYYSFIKPDPSTNTNELNNPVSSLFNLENISPNPFNDYLEVNYFLNKNSLIKIEILDVLGQPVYLLENENKLAGEHSTVINFDKNKLNNGVYFCKITVGEFLPVTERVVFMR